MRKTLTASLIAAILALAGCSGHIAGASADGNASPTPSTQSHQASMEPQPESSSQNDGDGTGASALTSDASAQAVQEQASREEAGTARVSTMELRVNGTLLQMTVADTQAASTLVELLRDNSIPLSLHPYGGFEMVDPLPQALPASDEQITTTPGDVMLYQGNQITIFLGSNTWSYTPLGHIENATAENLRDAFGPGEATVELAL